MKNFIHNKYFFILLIIACLNLFLSGCFSQKEITLEKGVEYKITKIVLKTGEEIDFTDDELGYAYLSNDVIVRVKDDGKSESFPLEKVDKIYTDEFSIEGTIGGTIVVIFIGILATYLFLISVFPGGVGG